MAATTPRMAQRFVDGHVDGIGYLHVHRRTKLPHQPPEAIAPNRFQCLPLGELLDHIGSPL